MTRPWKVAERWSRGKNPVGLTACFVLLGTSLTKGNLREARWRCTKAFWLLCWGLISLMQLLLHIDRKLSFSGDFPNLKLSTLEIQHGCFCCAVWGLFLVCSWRKWGRADLCGHFFLLLLCSNLVAQQTEWFWTYPCEFSPNVHYYHLQFKWGLNGTFGIQGLDFCRGLSPFKPSPGATWGLQLLGCRGHNQIVTYFKVWCDSRYLRGLGNDDSLDFD